MPAGKLARTQYARLSGFYFFYFASIGAFLPFWSLYLQQLGFGPREIGELLAATMATKVVAPNLWGWLADHTGKRILAIRVAAWLATAIFSASLVATGYWPMLVVLAAFSFFWNAALPQFEATTLDHLGAGTHRYSHIRLWGSVGFIVTVSVLGPLFERVGIEWLPAVMLVLLAGIWINTLVVSERVSVRIYKQPTLGATLKQPVVIALLVACFLLQASHGPYYTFFSIYMADHGYARAAIGWLWALGVLAEIVVFMYVSRWLPRFGARKLLLIAISVAAVRWLMTATLADYLGAMLVAQTLHAASFGLYHAAAIDMIYQLFPGRLQGRGQALYSSLSFGLGGALGALLSGYVWSALGPQWTFGMGALLAVAGALVAWRGVRMPVNVPGHVASG